MSEIPTARTDELPRDIAIESGFVTGNLDVLNDGITYRANPNASLRNPEEYGQPSVVKGEVTLRVAAELAIPAGITEFSVEQPDGEQALRQVQRFDGLVVYSARQEGNDHVMYALVGLRSDTETGKMVPAGSPAYWLRPGQEVTIGRSENSIKHNQLWGGGEYAGDVSRLHIQITNNQEGILEVVSKGANGTWGEFAQVSGENPAQESELSLGNFEIKPNPELRFAPVEDDPSYKELTMPFKQQLSEIFDRHKVELSRAKIEQEQAQSYEQRANAADRIRVIYDEIKKEQGPVRHKMQEAIKPFLRERAKLFREDDKPGFAHEGQAHFDRASREVVTARGKRVGRPFGTTRMGESIYIDAGNYPLLGQILPPARSTSYGTWEGNHNTNKFNETTGRTTTSAENVITIASAMLSGNYTGSEQPIRIRLIRKDSGAQYVLPIEIRDKVNLYEVVEGLHRVAALRLVEGLDAPLVGAERHDLLR